MATLVAVLLTSCLFLGATSLQLPDYITKCSTKSSDFETCALNSAKAAIPNIVRGNGEYLIPLLDPLTIDEFKMVYPKTTYLVRNMRVIGLKNIALESIRFDSDNQNVTFGGRLPSLNFTGDYHMEGVLVGRHIYGNGYLNAEYDDVALQYSTTYGLTTHDDGHLYVVLKDYKLHLDPRDVKINFDNMYNGNKVLGNELNKYLNENWRAMMAEIGQGVFELLGLSLHQIFREAATLVPYDDVLNETR